MAVKTWEQYIITQVRMEERQEQKHKLGGMWEEVCRRQWLERLLRAAFS